MMTKVIKVDSFILEQKIKNALEEIGMEVKDRAQDLCPVKTGQLQSHIDYEITGNKIEIGTRGVDYAEYVEYGTGPMVEAHGVHDPSSPVRKWKAQSDRGASGQTMPFLRTALFEMKFEIPKIVKRNLR